MKKLKMTEPYREEGPKFIIAVLGVCVLAVACTANQIQTASQLAGVVVNAIPAIVSLLSVNPTAISAANQAKSDFALAQSILASYQKNSADAATNLQRVSVALNEGQQNLNAIVSAAHLSGTNATKVQAAVNLAIGVTQDILADLPSSTGAATVAHPVKLPKHSVVQNQFNQIFAQ